MHPLTRHCKRDAHDVYVGRGSAYGNPFVIDVDGDRDQVVAKFRNWVYRNPDLIRFIRRNLAGKTLGCWCAPEACHADVLAEIANDPSISADDPILAFGSNEAGVHGKGSARFAREYRGAVRGQAYGLQGSSYALPTKNNLLQTLPIERVAEYAGGFIEFARANAHRHFDITRVGCGLAGFTDVQVAPLFFEAPDNCRLPHQWVRLRDPAAPAHIVIAGSRDVLDQQFPEHKVDALLSQLDVKPVIISGGARGVDLRGERYAIDHGLHFERHPADWDRYGRRSAGMIRNQFMSWRASHLVAIWDQQSPGTAGMIQIANADKLAVRVLRPC